MKLLYCCHADNYHIEKWIPAMQQVGIDVEVLTFRPNSSLSIAQHIANPIFNNITWFDFWALAPKIRQVYHEIQADVLLCSFASTYGLAGYLSGIKPLFVQTWSRDIGADASVNTKDAWISRIISRHICKQANGITTDGPHFKAFVETNWPEISQTNILSTWWGIDTDFWKSSPEEKKNARIKLNIPNDSKVIISPRGVYWYYRPHEVLKALLHVLEQQSDSFVIIPTLNHERDSETASFLSELNRHPRALIIDEFLDKNKFKTLLQASDLLLSVPLFDGISEVVQEGIACGLVPVLNPIPANKIIASEGLQVEFTASTQPKAYELSTSLVNAIKQLNESSILSNNVELIQQKCDVKQTANQLKNFLNLIS
ncbi:hypothetical protein EP331_13255 [bacterium]|nr:MAG: hypothetical protein EP331_13255 [bacterium]